MSTAFLESLASHPLVASVGWMLVHFVWQAALVGILSAMVLGMMRRSTASARYLVACAGLLLMTAAPVGTFAWLVSDAESGEWSMQPPVSMVESPAGASDLVSSMPAGETSAAPQTGKGTDARFVTSASSEDIGGEQPPFATTGWLIWIESFSATMQRWLPWCVVIWIAGVTCLAFRLLVGLRRVWLWKREGIELAGGELADAVRRLSGRMNLRQRVRLLEAARETVPAVIGWIRPAILVPASLLSGLTTSELESILAHELAHVRRHDYLVNLLQTVVETLLFYHPAVWWLSNRIRAERENCCDDIAVAVCGNRVVFARALARMEEIRCCGERLSIAANGGSLLHRIRRIVAPQPATSGPWWPAGAVTLGSLIVLAGGFWMTAQANSPPDFPEQDPPAAAGDSGRDEEKKINLRKLETVRTDSKTGAEQRVFTDISLVTGRGAESNTASLEMKYSNLMAYSFIPARLANELGAVEWGEIDFGETPPATPDSPQFIFDINPDGSPVVDLTQPAQPTGKTIHVHELSGPVDADTTIVPYPDDALWIPGHLGFYGMNQKEQHLFKIVRIEKVDLGVGPAFGPVTALVLDDTNSDFGLLGANWTQQVRGENGEGLWFEAATGSFVFMATPEHLKEAVAKAKAAMEAKKTDQDPGRMTVTSSDHGDTPPRQDRDGVTVLVSHTYPEGSRKSTGWVELNGAQVPIDVGIEHDGITVYKTLMFDIVAVDSKTEKTIWSIDWGKTTPMWKTVSIVELNRDGETELAVELYTTNRKTRELVYKYVLLADGVEVVPPAVSAPEVKQESAADRDEGKELKFQIVDRDDDRITRAAIAAFRHGRSAKELVRHFASVDQDINKFSGGTSTTNMETIVSAAERNYLEGAWVDAEEVLFNLPEGSGLRAEFSGENVEITKGNESTTVVITNGRIELIDAGGVIRAWASPDGGAEQLVIECREDLGEVVMAMTTRRIKPVAGYPEPPVQVVMNLETGAPADEKDPPHRGVRYEIQQGEDDGKPFMRMKMKWRYDLKRLADEASAESGLTIEELIYGKNNDSPKQTLTIPMPNIPPDAAKDGESKAESGAANENEDWGMMAHDSGLRSRLTLQTENPVVGQPLLFKLEVKNFGDKPTAVDAQRYYPFRVFRSFQPDGKPAQFIGMTPQTSGQEQPLKPGETLTLWENFDANELFLLENGEYKFFAEGGEWAAQAFWRDSNTLEIEIADGDQTPRNRFLGLLLKDLPEKWELANAISPTSGWNAVYLTHAPTGLKRDATGIQIWFTDEKLADDFELGTGDQKQIVTQLGRCEFDYMNVSAQPATLEFWPQYLEHIREAATNALTFEEKEESETDHADRAEELP